MSKKIKVLIVDDSAVIRKLLTKMIESSTDIEVVGLAQDPYAAREKLVELKPDVMTLDIEMPRMDGLSFLEKVMAHMPTKTLIVSSLAKKGSEIALRAFELGAIDVMEKPAIDVTQTLESMSSTILDKIRTVATARMPTPSTIKLGNYQGVKKNVSLSQTTHQVLAVASSTGGTEALKVFLAGFPADIPGTVIVQHMPAGFTRTYAESLNSKFPFEVKEAQDGDKVVPGRVLLAPGNFHVEIYREGGYYYTKLHQQPLMHGVRPAADFLMKTMAKYVGANGVGVVLTGMGKDGAEGLLEMKKSGAKTFAQSEKTCVVFGMPQAAIKLGAADEVLDLADISKEVIKHFKKRDVAA